MFVIPKYTNDESSTTIIMFININIILPAIRPFLAKKDARFKVFWPQLRSLEYQYPPSNILKYTKPLIQQ